MRSVVVYGLIDTKMDRDTFDDSCRTRFFVLTGVMIGINSSLAVLFGIIFLMIGVFSLIVGLTVLITLCIGEY